LKKILLPFMVCSILFILVIFNCTFAGVEVGLIGIWKFSESNMTLPANYSATMKINSDDSYTNDVSWTGNNKTFTGKITKADMTTKTISFKDNDSGITDYTYEFNSPKLKLITNNNQWVLYIKQ
jgi:hypothetical protein